MVLASGAWAGQYGGWLGVDLPVRPVRGQILAARILPAPISTGVWRGLTYLVPKADGSIVLGTTQEEAGFRDKATLQGIAGILAGVIELVPAIASAELHKIWAGLRPASPRRRSDSWGGAGAGRGAGCRWSLQERNNPQRRHGQAYYRLHYQRRGGTSSPVLPLPLLPLGETFA